MTRNCIVQSGRAVMYAVLPLSLILHFFCTASDKDGELKTIRKINLIHRWEMVKTDDGEVMITNDTAGIYYVHDLILYEVPYMAELTHVITDSDGNMIDEKLIKSEKKYRYFIFKKDHRFGLKYDSLDAKNGTSFTVDSFLNRKAFKEARFYQGGNDSLVKTAWNNDRSILTEHHINKTKFDESYCDTLIFTFMKSLNKID